MIGKVHYAMAFGALSAYVLQQGRKRAEVLAANGVRTSSPEEMAADFELQRSMRPGLRRAVEHVSLAWPPGETDKLANEVMARAALRYMEQRGIDLAQTQWVLVRHYDEDHPHAHLLLNRVTDMGEVVPDKHSHLRSAEACRKVEAEMGFVDAAKLGAEKTLARAEQAEPPAKNLARLRLKDQLTKALEKHLPAATTMPELQQALETEGIKLNVLLQRGKPQGVVFTAEAYPNLPMKGSEVARQYSGGELGKTLEAQAELARAAEQERQVRQQAEADRDRQAQFREVLDTALVRQLPGATDIETLQRGLATEDVTMRPLWQADGQLREISLAAAAFPGREMSGAALGLAYEPEALSRTLATQAAQRAIEQREADELRQRLREQTQQLADLTRDARWAEAESDYGRVAEIRYGKLTAATAQLATYQQQAQETVAGRAMLAEETQRADKHTEQRQQLRLAGLKALQEVLEERGTWRSWDDYQARVREFGFDLPHHKGTPVELRHLATGETFDLVLGQLGAAGPELRRQVQQEVFEQEKVSTGAVMAVKSELATMRYASEQELYEQLRPHGYVLEVTPTGEQQLRHKLSGRQVALTELKSDGQPVVPQIQAAVASRQAAFRRGRLEVEAGPEGSAAERAEYLGRRLAATGAQVESITPPGVDGRVELMYRYEWRGTQADPMNQALRQLQATPGILVREQDQGFHQPAAEWPRRVGEAGQALLLLYDSGQRLAADRVAAATRLLEEKGAQVGPAWPQADGSIELLISYHTRHPDFAALSERLDQWDKLADIDVVETDYARSMRAETRQALAAAGLSLPSEVVRPGRSAEPVPSKEAEIDFDD